MTLKIQIRCQHPSNENERMHPTIQPKLIIYYLKQQLAKKVKLSNRRSCRRRAVTATAIADRHGHMRMHAAFNIDRENRTHCNPMLQKVVVNGATGRCDAMGIRRRTSAPAILWTVVQLWLGTGFDLLWLGAVRWSMYNDGSVLNSDNLYLIIALVLYKF